jgi:glucose/mannose-6-phosphate isomerase
MRIGIFARFRDKLIDMKRKEAMRSMEKYIENFPQNLREAVEIGKAAVGGFKTDRVNKVLIAGLGGSGIGGRVVSQLVWDECEVPIEIINDYRIPAWVDEFTLFIACSYSGNTEETLSALNEATMHNAKISCVTSGGKLREIAYEMGYNCIEIPGGQPPRTSFGYNATQLFFILHAYGLIDNSFSKDLINAAGLLDEESGLLRAEAAAIAKKLSGTTPVIYSESHSEGIAIRLRQQLNENAKMLCWHHVLPEMNHNELVGWAGGDKSFSAIIMHTPEDLPPTVRRMELTAAIIEKYTATVVHLRPKGANRIENAYYLIHLGDWISYFLAKEPSVDPIEIDVIDYLKSELAKD